MLLQEEVAKELNVPVECQRFWLWAKRQNHTYRPNRPLTDQEEAQTVISAAQEYILLLVLHFTRASCMFSIRSSIIFVVGLTENDSALS